MFLLTKKEKNQLFGRFVLVFNAIDSTSFYQYEGNGERIKKEGTGRVIKKMRERKMSPFSYILMSKKI